MNSYIEPLLGFPARNQPGCREIPPPVAEKSAGSSPRLARLVRGKRPPGLLVGWRATPRSVTIAVDQRAGRHAKGRVEDDAPSAAMRDPARCVTSSAPRSSMGNLPALAAARSTVAMGAATKNGTPAAFRRSRQGYVPTLLACRRWARDPMAPNHPQPPCGGVGRGGRRRPAGASLMPSWRSSQAVSRAPCMPGTRLVGVQRRTSFPDSIQRRPDHPGQCRTDWPGRAACSGCGSRRRRDDLRDRACRSRCTRRGSSSADLVARRERAGDLLMGASACSSRGALPRGRSSRPRRRFTASVARARQLFETAAENARSGACALRRLWRPAPSPYLPRSRWPGDAPDPSRVARAVLRRAAGRAPPPPARQLPLIEQPSAPSRPVAS